jgi:HEPN/Toprim N-terminal domain 1
MGSIITLGLDRLELDWGKNGVGINHSKLFLPGDIRDVPYFYADNEREVKPGYARALRSVVKRLELLGYTISKCKQIYQDLQKEMPDGYASPVISFDVFASTLKKVDVGRVRLPCETEDYRAGAFVAYNIFADPEFQKISAKLKNFKRWDAEFFENLDPYLIIRLLAENPKNLDLDVVWRFSDAVEGGWVEQSALYEGLSNTDRYLVVTEGSSDAAILKKSLPKVAEDVADFFDFIDMSENYPFTGTGNVTRFIQGLAKIKIQNRILVVLDNDTAGHSALQTLQTLNLPSNIKITVLPDIVDCKKVRTLGPSGKKSENVNGRAASIEWFLDLKHGSGKHPTVRWTSYDARLKKYQGELEGKEEYTRVFLKLADRNSNYDFSKLEYLWSHLLECCISENPG